MLPKRRVKVSDQKKEEVNSAEFTQSLRIQLRQMA